MPLAWTGENFGVDALAIGDDAADFLVAAAGLSFTGAAPGTAYVVAGIDHEDDDDQGEDDDQDEDDD